MSWNPFISGTARQAQDMIKQVQKLFNAQRDILSAQAIEALEMALKNARKAAAGRDEKELRQKIDELEGAANKWIKAYPNPAIRENIEVLLVALSVAMAIRTFLAQPFKIPTGSMQPTLWGIVPSPRLPLGESPPPDMRNDPKVEIPGAFSRFFQFWDHGYSYVNITAPEDGRLEQVYPPQKFLLFNLKQQYVFNGKTYTVWLPADDLFMHAGYQIGNSGIVINSPQLKAGEPIAKVLVKAGDHVFVDRLTYNFRNPKRGEIIVFKTEGIPLIREQDQFYIKRMVAMGGEKLQIGNDRHLIIDGKRLDENTPHFDKVYSFDPSKPPRSSQYSGHVNGYVIKKFGYGDGMADGIAHDYVDQNFVHSVEPHHYFAMGDNTMDSSDSRYWGDLPENNIIGKYFCVYWPFTERFGWSVY